MWFLRAALCRIGASSGLSRHDPERTYIPPWNGFRCRVCGATAPTEAELLHFPQSDSYYVGNDKKERD